MVQWHQEMSGRKPSGGLKRSFRATNRRLAWRGSEPTLTKMVEGKEEEKRKPARCLGKRRKTKLLKAKTANVLDKATKRLQKAEIVTVKENLADKLFVRRNIITKGAIIEVKAGGENRFAIVTSRPGQEGSIEAMLLSEEEAKAALAKKEKAKAKKPAAAAEKKAKEAAEKPAENA